MAPLGGEPQAAAGGGDVRRGRALQDALQGLHGRTPLRYEMTVIPFFCSECARTTAAAGPRCLLAGPAGLRVAKRARGCKFCMQHQRGLRAAT